MSETRSAKQNNNLNGELTLKNLITSNHLRYLTCDNKGLALATPTHANIVANHTLAANKLTVGAFTGAAAGTLTLPAATPDTVVVYQQGELFDSNFALTIKCATGDTFEADCHIALSTAQTDERDTSAADDTSIAITAAADNNTWGGVGSQICFYCGTSMKWRVKLGNIVPTGTGVAGTTVAFA